MDLWDISSTMFFYRHDHLDLRFRLRTTFFAISSEVQRTFRAVCSRFYVYRFVRARYNSS
jgi:hypothetical protein